MLTVIARGLADGCPSAGENAPLVGGFPNRLLPLPCGLGRGVQGATPTRGVTDTILSHKLEHEPWVSGFQEPQSLGHIPAGYTDLQTSKNLPHLSVDQAVFFLASREVW